MHFPLVLALAFTAAKASPIVTLSYGIFEGFTNGNLTQFLGMPYAEPPVGELRFRRPRSPVPRFGVQKALQFGPACSQEALSTVPILPPPTFNFSTSEDCLTINVIKPAIATSKKLPVAFWIHGGAFEIGDSTDTSGIPIVQRSIDIGEPVIFVTANYRLNAFGFLGGKQVLEAGIANLGLHDQRMAMKWVQRHIAAFGGDPNRVTIMGVSSGAISVAYHLLYNEGNTENLFHGAFMESGATTSTESIINMQYAYDELVQLTQCTDTPDSLECLRKVPYETLTAAINTTHNQFSYSSVSNTWRPTIDDDLLKTSPLCAASKGLFAKVSLISGDVEDEGTVFSLSTLNITTDAEFMEYMQTYLLKGATPEEMQQIAAAYPSDPSVGSPFNTGSANAITPQYKRLSAIQGDIVFQGPRRLLLQSASQTQDAWGYLYKRGKSLIPVLGALHGSDINTWYDLNATSTDFFAVDALIHFVNTLDPNASPQNNTTFWPQWKSTASGSLLTFSDSSITVSQDAFRSDSINVVNRVVMSIAERSGICN